MNRTNRLMISALKSDASVLLSIHSSSELKPIHYVNIYLSSLSRLSLNICKPLKSYLSEYPLLSITYILLFVHYLSVRHMSSHSLIQLIN